MERAIWYQLPRLVFFKLWLVVNGVLSGTIHFKSVGPAAISTLKRVYLNILQRKC